MLRYVLKRLGMTVLVLFLVTTAVGMLIYLIPGNPAQALLGSRADPVSVAQVERLLLLDKPLWYQLWHFDSGVMQGDLGTDVINGRPVAQLIADVLPNTLILAVSGLVVAVGLGIPMGIFAATHPGSILDRVLALASVAMTTIPPYVAGLLLLLIFSVQFRVLPSIGAGSLGDPVDYLRHLVLPTAALAMAWTGYFARVVRTSMLEVLGADYIRTAHALGIARRVVFYKYALKNAIVPVVAVLGVALGGLMGGAIFVEVIFTRPGLGTLIYHAIEIRNYPIVRGGVLVIAVLFVLSNLLADLAYFALDPRMRARGLSTAWKR